MKELNIIYSDNYLKYELGPDNPISRTKTRDFLQRLKEDGKIDYKVMGAPKAGEEDLLLVHTPKYLQELKW